VSNESPFGNLPVAGSAGMPFATQPTTQPAPQQNGAALPSEAPQEMIDPNDPRLVSEPQDVNLGADAFAAAPLPPAGRYKAKLKLEGVKDEQGHVSPWSISKTVKDGSPYYQTTVSATIIDPSGKWDGITLYPAFGGYVGTLLNKQGASKIGTIIGKLGPQPSGQPWVPPGAKLNQKQWIELFVKALAGEPTIGIEVEWTWNCQVCSDAVKTAKAAGQQANYARSFEGMTHFPLEQDKQKQLQGHRYSPDKMCEVNKGHGFSRARAYIHSFLSESEVK
jgi:hypothetical protein